jgi:DNA-binding protein HU-beta
LICPGNTGDLIAGRGKTGPTRHLFARGVCAATLDPLISGPSEVASTASQSARPPAKGERRSEEMNKRDLVDAISMRMGDKKTAAEAVNAVLDTIQKTVAGGDKVSITGFGVFEKQVRPARTARNPATGAAIKVPKTSVPKFRAGADFKAMVNNKKR